MESAVILGYEDLSSYVGVGKAMLYKWMRLYGFPPSTPFRKSRVEKSSWAKQKVDDWILNNKELVDNGVRTSNLFNRRGEGNEKHVSG